jgi:regulator of replication initiation timing
MDKELEILETEQSQETALVSINGNEATVFDFLDDTLATISDNQKSLLNSQAANRELLGVVIQDNFNLKEENSRLRERILELERRMAQQNREEQQQREMLRREMDTKIANVQEMAIEAMVTAKSTEVPDVKAVSTKLGCLGALFGGGGLKIVTLPRAKANNDSSAIPTAASVNVSAGQHGSHPKPMFPPE